MAKFYKFDFTKELEKMNIAKWDARRLEAFSKDYVVQFEKLRARLTEISGSHKTQQAYKKDENFSKKLEKDLKKEVVTLLKRYAKVADVLDSWKKTNNQFAKAMFAKLKQKYDTMR